MRVPKKIVDLSVVIFSYNYKRYIKKCLDSIIDQTVQPMEIIIIDDASQDGSQELLLSYQNLFSHINLIMNKENQGLFANCQLSSNLITGKYVYQHAIDDYVMPNFFEKTTNMLELFPEAVLCTTDGVFFYEEKDQYIYCHNPQFKDQVLISPKEIVKIFKTSNFWIPTHATIFRTDIYKKHINFSEKFALHQDWLSVHSIALRYSICYVPEPLATLRAHSQQYSQKFSIEKRKDIWAQIFKYLLDPNNKDLLRAFKKTSLFKHLLNDNNGFNRKQAQEFLKFGLSKSCWWKLFSFKFILDTLKLIYANYSK